MSKIVIPTPSSVLVPRDAYRFWPESEDICKGSGKKLVRFIFEKNELTDFELDKLSRLLKEIKDNKIKGFQIPPEWSHNHILRFCYGTNWKTRNAVKCLIAHLQWRKALIPNTYRELYPKVNELLYSGVFYVHGRDNRFRPLIIMNFPKINFKKHSIDEYTNVLCFLLEYIIDKMLLPGQIENWVVLTDLGKNGLGNMSISSLKQVLEILQSNYRCRLAVNYIVNPPSSIWLLWKCIKPFLDDITIDKIKISKGSVSQDMVSHFNPYQVERKYGGKAPDLDVYWPPTVPETSFAAKDDMIKLSKKDSYYEYYPKQEEPVEEPVKHQYSKKFKIKRVNSQEMESYNNSEVEIEDIDDDPFARSDAENHEENLIDFEVVSPFTRGKERNPTFMSFGQTASMEFQKKLTLRLTTLEKKQNKSKESAESLESDHDFEPDYEKNLILHINEENIEKNEIQQEDIGTDDNLGRCGYLNNGCGIIRNSCIVI